MDLAHPGKQLVRRFFLQRLYARDTRERRLVTALQHVELNQRCAQATLGGLVGDLVLAKDTVDVTPNLLGHFGELGIIADDLLDAVIQLIGKARQIGRFVDALPRFCADR